MKALLVLAALAVSATAMVSEAQAGSVRGYVTKRGTYVAPHMKTSPNSYRYDNYSHHGNVNPYTGKRGTKR